VDVGHRSINIMVCNQEISTDMAHGDTQNLFHKHFLKLTIIIIQLYNQDTYLHIILNYIDIHSLLGLIVTSETCQISRHREPPSDFQVVLLVSGDS
jgi:hypothetical protein